MAPRTRRSLAMPDSPATPAASAGPSTPHDATSSAPPKRGRGRPRKSILPVESGSSAVSAADSRSESGEYSTPATSNFVTPVPSTAVGKSTAKASTSQSEQLELRTRGSTRKPSAPGSSRAVRASTARHRPKPGHPLFLDIGFGDDDDDLDVDFEDDHDDDPSAAVARRMQREEYKKSGLALLSQPGSSAPTPPRTTRNTRASRIPAVAAQQQGAAEKQDADRNEDDDEEEYINDVLMGLGSAKDKKGKGKAQPRTAKRKEPPTMAASDSDEPETHPRRKRAKTNAAPIDLGSEDEVDSEDEPMAKSRRLRRQSSSSEYGDTEPDEAEDEDGDYASDEDEDDNGTGTGAGNGNDTTDNDNAVQAPGRRRALQRQRQRQRRHFGAPEPNEREKLMMHHPVLKTLWSDLEKMPILKAGKAEQPYAITQQLKPFQLEGLAWMKAMESTQWKGGLLGDEMGLGKTIQAVSLIMSDHPAKNPTLVLVPPVALMQWTAEIDKYTRGALKTLVFHGTNTKAKNMTARELKKFDVLLMSYNTLESTYRKQEKGFKRKEGLYKEKSAIHSLTYHRVILDEAHCIKTKTTMTAKATFALNAPYRWCLTGTPLQNRIGEFFSLVRFLGIEPFASYFCKDCTCSKLEWTVDQEGMCTQCTHHSMRHISVFNHELLNPIQRFGNHGEGAEAFKKLRLLTERIMLRRLKKDHTNSMELPVKEIYVDNQFFGEAENDFASSIMSSGQRKFDTYVAQGVMLNNYANIFGLIMQMRQVADHPDLILKKSAEGGQNILICCICDEPAEEAIRSRCKHDFCRSCVKTFINSQEDQDGQPECPRCHIPLSIDLEQPEMEQDEAQVKKSSIINRIKMENWTSSSKIELLVHELHRLRKNNATHKSIIFSQFTTMLQLIEWRLRRAGITTVMLDGSMTPAQRQGSINHFMQNVDVECFLVSLKAGGVALNLTEASRVFIVDPWWNPAAEWQSADRCHRIGQTRPCVITRLCIEDSVESRMVLLQEKKTSMINSTINSDDAAMESLTPADLQFLFRGN